MLTPQSRQRTLEATELTLGPRLQGLISDMDRIIGMPAHEVVMEVGIRACFVGACTRLVLKFMFIWHNVPCVHKPFAAVAQCMMNSLHRGQVIEPEP